MTAVSIIASVKSDAKKVMETLGSDPLFRSLVDKDLRGSLGDIYKGFYVGELTDSPQISTSTVS